MSLKDKRILVGVISGVHGLKGNVIIKSFTEPAENICKLKILDEMDHNIKITLIKQNEKSFLLCKLENIDNRTEAEKLKGKRLFCLNSDLPELDNEEFYIENLINLKVLDNDHKEIGKIKAFFNFGAGDIIEIQFENKEIELFPFTKELFPEINKDYLILDINIWKLKNQL